MDKFVEVGRTSEVPDSTMKAVKFGNRELLLARVGDAYYLAENKCPHLAARLSLGKLEGTVVTCPRHASRFDLADGHVVRWTDWSGIKLSLSRLIKPPRPLKTYRVKVEGDRILAAL